MVFIRIISITQYCRLGNRLDEVKNHEKENSVKGWQGVLKKIGYWIMITFAFMIAAGLIEIGEIISVDLQITTLLGWFVLASLIVNEARSICENFVEAGFNVPKVLSNGLAVADKLINKESEDEE